MAIHELALLATYYDVTVENIESVTADADYSEMLTLTGPCRCGSMPALALPRPKRTATPPGFAPAAPRRAPAVRTPPQPRRRPANGRRETKNDTARRLRGLGGRRRRRRSRSSC